MSTCTRSGSLSDKCTALKLQTTLLYNAWTLPVASEPPLPSWHAGCESPGLQALSYSLLGSLATQIAFNFSTDHHATVPKWRPQATACCALSDEQRLVVHPKQSGLPGCSLWSCCGACLQGRVKILPGKR